MLRLVCLSDTHNRHDALSLPEGDVLIHAGDFSTTGTLQETEAFAQWFCAQPHATKILVPGNHDKYMEQNPSLGKALFPGVNVLIDDVLDLGGIRFYGSPMTPEYGNYSFHYKRSEGYGIWEPIHDLLPDVLITHGPPAFVRDKVNHTGTHAGCLDLLKAVIFAEPTFHIFGHIHDGYGMAVPEFIKTAFSNVAICNGSLEPVNPVTIIEHDEW